ncbi:MAG: lipopolysaccharide heptosyltransferase II [Candidatus Omnitrophica bacterium]|nr:lipopolysaccharide heptosyltransferase II [Candidatus Omnitrophota bacterium]
MIPNRILIWEPNWIGDVLFSTPFIRTIRMRFPDAYIACITVPSCREILEANPRIDEVLLFDERTVNRGIMKKIDFIRELRKKRFDTVILLHRSLTRAIVASLGGISERIGYRYPKRNLFLTVKAAPGPTPVHRVENFLTLARAIGAGDGTPELEFYYKPEDENYIRRFLKEHKISSDDVVIVINPGGNWEPKRWHIQRYIELCRELLKKPRVKLVVSGARQDVGLYLQIQEALSVPIFSLAGRISLRQLGALLKRADLMISGDSGPLHVALALKRKAIALFGPTSPSLTGPLGAPDCRIIAKDVGCAIPCYRVSCRDRRCMNAIEVHEVVRAVEEMLGI